MTDQNTIPLNQVDTEFAGPDPLLDEVVNTGEGAVSGSTPATTSDDDMLENMHDVGLHLDEDPDNPQPLNIAQQIEEAEKAHWNH